MAAYKSLKIEQFTRKPGVDRGHECGGCYLQQLDCQYGQVTNQLEAIQVTKGEWKQLPTFGNRKYKVAKESKVHSMEAVTWANEKQIGEVKQGAVIEAMRIEEAPVSRKPAGHTRIEFEPQRWVGVFSADLVQDAAVAGQGLQLTDEHGGQESTPCPTP